METVFCMKLEVRSQETGENVFTYTEDMEPELLDCGNYFTVYYIWNPGDEEEEIVSCDYPTDRYYYIAEEVRKVG